MTYYHRALPSTTPKTMNHRTDTTCLGGPHPKIMHMALTVAADITKTSWAKHWINYSPLPVHLPMVT